MRIKKEGIPEEGDIVLATVTRVEPHAAFIELDEYDNVNGLIHISELSKSWVKNIKTFLRINQKVVCKVIRVKEKERFVQCSIRRVSDYDMRAKWDQVRRQKRVEAIIEMIAKKTGKKFEDVYAILKPLEEEFGEIYFAFEEAKKEGKKFFEGRIPKEIVDVVWEIVDKSISLPRVNISGVLTLQSYASDGVERIRKILSNIDANIIYLGAPRYQLVVEAVDYKEAERKLQEILKNIEKSITKTEIMNFERLKK